jgi:hypothetical protein
LTVNLSDQRRSRAATSRCKAATRSRSSSDRTSSCSDTRPPRRHLKERSHPGSA